MPRTVYNKQYLSALCFGFVFVFAVDFRKVNSYKLYEEIFARNGAIGGKGQFQSRNHMVENSVQPLRVDGKSRSEARNQERIAVPDEKIEVDSSGTLGFKSSISGRGEYKNVRNWQNLKRSLKQWNSVSHRPYQFVRISRGKRSEDQSSFAVKQTTATDDSIQAGLLGAVATVVLLVALVVCLHAPCLCLRRRRKSDPDLDLIDCPNPAAHGGKCGKCLFDRASRKFPRKAKHPGRASPTPVSTGTNEELFLASESMYSAQPPWMDDYMAGTTRDLPRPKKSRSIVQAILQRSRSRDKFRYEFLAAKYGYNYKQFEDSGKRNSVYDEHEPDWYSAGEFLNRQSRYRAQRSYGSTDAGRSSAHGCCKWSRDSTKSSNQGVEDILKMKPRRRQVVELQEFPVGFSESYASVENNCKDQDIIFDPCQEGPVRSSKLDPCTQSESNLDSYFSELDEKARKNNSVDDGRSGKSCIKSGDSSPNSNAKIVQFYPSRFNYKTKFVQGGSEKYHCEKHRKLIDGERDLDQGLIGEESSSEDLMSFDEEDDNRNTLFDYSLHMEHNRGHTNPYQYLAGFNGYAEMPQYAYFSSPQNKMRRTVRSASELRRVGEPMFASTSRKAPLKKRRPVSSSDTSLNRTHVLRELNSVGLAKSARNRRKKKPRDSRIDPLSGMMSPMRNPKSRTASLQGSAMNQERSYVVQMPNLSCKEEILKEQDEGKAVQKIPQDGTLILNKLEILEHGRAGTLILNKLEILEHEQADKGSTIDYSHVPKDIDPKYLNSNYLRDEPVRDTDSDDTENHNISMSTHKCAHSHVHCREAGKEGKTSEEVFSTPQTSL